MSKYIQLINLDEIKTLRITCGKCGKHWPVFVGSEEHEIQKKCNCKGPLIPEPHLKYIEEVLKNINSIQKYLKGFEISIEFETEK